MEKKKMKTLYNDTVSTTLDSWWDVDKVEYYNDGDVVIYYKEKSKDDK